MRPWRITLDGEQSYSLESHCPSIGWFVTTKKPSIDDIPEAGKDQVGHRQVRTRWLGVGYGWVSVASGWLQGGYGVITRWLRGGYRVVTGWLWDGYPVVIEWLRGGDRVVTGW